MSSDDFQNLRSQLNGSRQRLERDERNLFLARQRLDQIEAKLTKLNRTFDPGNSQQKAERERLKAQHDRLNGQINELNTSLTVNQRDLIASAGRFAQFTDPRRQITNLNDSFPVLLLPLRMETRFKKLQIDGSTRHQLWVRVYPDDCAIDTFEEVLSETELRNARHYWAQIWRAGDDDSLRRAAWRNIVGSHSVGRSLWILENYRPLEGVEPPTRDAKTIVLVIATSTPPPADQIAPIAAFWEATWRGFEDADALKAAQNALTSAVGEAKALHIIANYRPFNLEDSPPETLSQAEAKVIVSMVTFEPDDETATKRQAWSRAPRVDVLPDRLVLMGYTADTLIFEQLGNFIPSPLIVGPDPLASEDDQIHQEGDDIFISAGMRWMVDFDEAERVGMGFRVNLTPDQYAAGFDKLMVLGVRLSADERDGQATFEHLLKNHHHSRSGLRLLWQGTPTNNTDEDGSADYTTNTDADNSYDLIADGGYLFEPTADWTKRTDGQWLAELLGVDVELFRRVKGADHTDVRDAQAMNTALFPATIGYFMDTMLAPIFTDADVDFVHAFFTNLVSGRGMLSAIRIGHQPYGILPTTVYSRMQWPRRQFNTVNLTHGQMGTGSPQLAKLHDVLMRAYAMWGDLRQDVAHIGQDGGDPHQVLLDVLGLHPTSAEFHQRYAESLEQIINKMSFQGLLEQFGVKLSTFLQGVNVLIENGYNPLINPRPEILDKYFFQKPNPVNTENLIHDLPLSEVEGIRPYTTDDRNYIEWLIDTARVSLDALRKQEGFAQTPTALLYAMLRHALILGYYDTGIRLDVAAKQQPPAYAHQMRREASFIHVSEQAKASESRFRLLYDNATTIGANSDLNVADYITSILHVSKDAIRLKAQIAALERLQNLPTARLERVFVEHLDTCSYRLDAWMSGLVNYRLLMMRQSTSATTGEMTGRQGLYLGAFGWLEDARPSDKVRQAVPLDDELNAIFSREGEPELMRDSDNSGFVHTPSLNHAVTAAVLRNGYRNTATPTDAGVFSVNLSSERVRRAMTIIEGMHNGQSLGALLGYQFERGLHDRYNEAEVDQFIYQLRKAFPLVADHLKDTAEPVDDAATSTEESIQTVEARNVLDGVALVDHIQSTGKGTYPFGKNWLPDSTPAQAKIINDEVQRLLDTHDAVSDLGIAEGIHQVAQGNYDRAAASLEAFASGGLPPVPDVVQTPRSGIGLTHRVGVHLRPALSPLASPVALDLTPRASAEPAINHWLASLLPAPDQIGVVVTFSDEAGGSGQQVITQADLGLQPIDLLYLLNVESEQAMTAFDDRIIRHVRAGKRPDTRIIILYTQSIAPRLTFFEVAALISELRSLIAGARPLRATDMSLPDEAGASNPPLPDYHTNRLTHLRDALTGPGNAVDDLRALITELQPLLDDVEAHRADLIADVDDRLNRFLEAAARLNLFGLPQTGYGYFMDWKRQRYSALLKKVQGLLKSWGGDKGKLDAFDDLLAEYDALAADTTDEARIEMLAKLEAIIAVGLTDSPDDPAAYLTTIMDHRADFVAKRDEFTSILSTSTPNVSSLLAMVENASTGIETFDIIDLHLNDDGGEIVRFCGDLYINAGNIIEEVETALDTLDNSLDDYSAATGAADREAAFNAAAHALLGDDFMVLPDFRFTDAGAAELKKAHDSTPALMGHLTGALEVDFPVDDWLYGVARVRDALSHWEALTMIVEALKATELNLHPLQMPYQDDDRWLALDYPPDLRIDTDKLLYTAHYAVLFNQNAVQCGLLLDEWTEVIPAAEETTGVTFHFDRPNSEPPQVMLLVTPPHFNGRWEWADLVDALHETLEMAKRRAVEPDQIAATDYARFLPATISAVTFHPITIALNYALANGVFELIQTGGDNA
jgi:hypothetical protein